MYIYIYRCIHNVSRNICLQVESVWLHTHYVCLQYIMHVYSHSFRLHDMGPAAGRSLAVEPHSLSQLHPAKGLLSSVPTVELVSG